MCTITPFTLYISITLCILSHCKYWLILKVIWNLKPFQPLNETFWLPFQQPPESHLQSSPPPQTKTEQKLHIYLYGSTRTSLEGITHFIFTLTSLGITLLLCRFMFTYSLEAGKDGGLRHNPKLHKNQQRNKFLIWLLKKIIFWMVIILYTRAHKTDSFDNRSPTGNSPYVHSSRISQRKVFKPADNILNILRMSTK
jgi:hypothetical protein